MKTKKALRIGILMLALLVACSCLFTACKKADKPTTTEYKEGPEVGVYYYATDLGEYTMTLSGNYKFTLNYKDTTKSGVYSLSGEVITFDFDTEADGTLTGKLADEVITLTYDGVAMRMLRKVNYSVTFNSNGGSNVAEQDILNGKPATRPADPTRDGYLFVGWYADEACKTPYNFGSAVSANITLYAKWVEGSAEDTEYTVDFDLGYEGGQVPEARKTLGGQLFELPMVEREGYVFQGWWISMHEDGAKLSYKHAEGMVFRANTTLFALWQEEGKIAPVVTVDATSIRWDAISGAQYHIVIKTAEGYAIKDEPTSGSTIVSMNFADYDPGDYEIHVTATVAGQAYTTVRYYRNRTLDRVSLFEVVEPSALVFNKVANAEKYLVTVICGDSRHVHTDVDIGESASYNFADCAMPAEGIRFIVTAVAEGYASTQSEVFTYQRTLGSIGELVLDEETQTVRWEGVENASGYMVSIVYGDGEAVWFDNGAKTALDLKELAAGELKISVYAKAKGYASSEIVTLTYNKQALATPSGIALEGSVLSWSAAAGATGYEVKVGDKTFTVENGTALDIADKAAWAAGESYEISVRALGTANSAWSEVLSVSTNTMSALSYSQSILSWNPVLDADRYEVQVNDGQIISIVGKNAAEITLTQSGKNTLKVRYVNGDGASEWVRMEVTAYAITFDGRGGDSVSVVYKAVGDPLELPAPDKQGYAFAAWYNTPDGPLSNGAAYNDGIFAGSSDMMLYAQYTAKRYHVEYNMVGGGTSTQSGATVTYNEHYKLDVPTAISGTAAFGGWYSAPNGMGTKYTDSNGNSLAPWEGLEDVQMYAHWAELVLQYTLTKVNGVEVYSVIQGIGAAAISEITIPATYNGLPVGMVAGNAFKGCSNLVSINIPNTVLVISSLDVFTGCTALTNINIYDAGAENPNYVSADGVLFEKKLSASGIEELNFLFMPLAKTGSYRIPNNVVSIPANAFAGCALSQITIPTSVTGIGTEAFANCVNLKSVVFEESANAPALTLGNRIFSGCTSLEKIVLPARLSYIPLDRFALSKPTGSPAVENPETNFALDAFLGCKSLKQIVVTAGNKTYKTVDGVIYSADGNTLLYVPATVSGKFEVPVGTKTIANGAFFQTGVTSVTIPNTVTTIGTCAFYGCEQLKSVTFEAKGFNALSIGKYAFRGCTALTTVTTPATMATIGEGAFMNCESLTAITIGRDVTSVGAKAFLGCVKLKTVEISAINELKFGSDAFYGCESINEITLPATVSEIPGIFAGCLTLQSVVVSPDNPYLESVDGVVYNETKTELLFYPIARKGEFVLLESVTKIASGVFAGNVNLTKITLSDNLTEIGNGAFRDCVNLSQIDFGAANAETLVIGDYAFYGAGLERVTIPNNVEVIGKYSFADMEALAEVILNSGLTLIDEGAFFKTVALEAIEIPATVTEIGDFAFKGSAVGEVTFAANSTLKIIGEGAFMTHYDMRQYHHYVCDFTEIIIPKSVEIIKAYAFTSGRQSPWYQHPLRSVTFEEGSQLHTIGARAFAYTELEEIVIPKSVTSIEAYAFAGNEYLRYVEFEEGGTEPLVLGTQSTAMYDANGDTVTGPKEVGHAFEEGESLEEVILPSRLTEIKEYAFYFCNSGDMVISFGDEPQLTTIGAYAFKDCDLADIVIPKSVKNLDPVDGVDRLGIGEGAFDGAKVEVISFEEGGTDPLTIGPSAFISCTETLQINLPSRLAPYTSVSGSQIPAISISVFTADHNYRCSSLTQINVEEGSQYVGSIDGVLYANNFTELVLVPEQYAGTTLTVPASVEKIGDMAMFMLASVETVIFEEGSALKSIGEEAFYQAAKLTDVALPDGVTDIGKDAFYGCTSLTSFTIPQDMEKFDAGVLEGCNNIKNFYVAAGSPYMKAENGVLFSADGTELLAYPLAAEATTYTVPAGVKVIGANAFYGNKYLETIILPNGLERIEEYAFRAILALKSVTIPNTVELIDSYAFDNAKALESVTFEAGGSVALSISKNAFSYSKLKSIILPQRLIAIGDYGFAYSYSLAEVVFQEGMELEVIGTSAFSGAAITSLHLPSVKELGSSVFDSCSELVTVVIDEGLVRMGSKVFVSCNSLESVYFPASLEKMGTSTFGFGWNGDANLKTVVFAEGSRLTELPAGTFANTGLESFEIPASVTSMGSPARSDYGSYEENGVFMGCENLTTITFAAGSKCTNIGNAAFMDCTALKSINIPASVVSIGIEAFYGCTALESVVIPETVAYLGQSVFEDCENLSNVTYNAVATVIPYGAFNGCRMLTSFVIPTTVTEISDWAFYRTGITEIVIPTTVTRVGDYAFSGTMLQQITVPESVTEIGRAAFADCTELTTAIIHANLEILGFEAAYVGNSEGVFSDCTALTTVILPENLPYIADYTFYGCTALKTIELPAGLTKLGMAFVDSGLETFTVAEGSTYLAAQDGILYNADKTEIVSCPPCYAATKITIPKEVVSIGKNTFSGLANLQEVVFENGDTPLSIGDRAFYNCPNLVLVQLPDRLTSLGAAAFAGCGIRSIVIPEGVETIESETFYHCANLGEVILPESLQIIKSSAFAGCRNLYRITLPSKLSAIEADAFEGCIGLVEIENKPGLVLKAGDEGFGQVAYHALHIYTEGQSQIVKLGDYITLAHGGEVILVSYMGTDTDIVIPDGVTVINAELFEDRTVTSLRLPEGLKVIGDSAFKCKNSLLTEVVLPSTLTTIGDDAFYNQKGLTTMVIPASVTQIGAYAFCNTSIELFFVAASEAGSGWDSKWNYIDYYSGNSAVLYGYTGQEITYTFQVDGGTAVDPITSSVAIQLPTAAIKEGFYFGGWYDNAEFTGEALSGNYYSSQKTTLYAKWMTEEEYNSQFLGTSPETAIELVLGVAVNGSIDEAYAKMYYTITVSETGYYTIYTTGPNDTEGRVYDDLAEARKEYGSAVGSNSDSGEGFNFQINCKLEAGVTYWVRVAMYSSGTGEYTLIIEKQ